MEMNEALASGKRRRRERRRGRETRVPRLIKSLLSLIPPNERAKSLINQLRYKERVLVAYYASVYIFEAEEADPQAKEAHSKELKRVGQEDFRSIFHCRCFSCVHNFTVKWQKSPNRKVMDELIVDVLEGSQEIPQDILEASQDEGFLKNKKELMKKEEEH